MHKATVESYWMNEVRGAKKTADGKYFVSLPYCPYCEKYVESLKTHLEEEEKH